jgi:hypothetical protein
MMFKFEYTGIGGFRRANLSFRNGAANIMTACAPVDESFSPFAGQAVVTLTNTEPTDTITMSNIIVRYNDPGNLSDTVNYTPGGTVALGTPPNAIRFRRNARGTLPLGSAAVRSAGHIP